MKVEIDQANVKTNWARRQLWSIYALLTIFSSASPELCSSGLSAEDSDLNKAGAAILELEARIDQFNQGYGLALWLSDDFPTTESLKLRALALEEIRQIYAEGLEELSEEDIEALSPVLARKLKLLRLRPEFPMFRDVDQRKALLRQRSDFHELFNTGCDETKKNCADHNARLESAYFDLVQSLNNAARDWGLNDLAEWNSSAYDFDGANPAENQDRLWEAIQPLHKALQCHIQHTIAENDELTWPQLSLLDNVTISNLLGLHDLVRGELPSLSELDQAIEGRFNSVEDIFREAESYYTGMGYPPLPDRFWAESRFVKPVWRESCPRYGTNIGWTDDVRVILCGKLDQETFDWAHSILAFLYYDIAFAEQDWVFRDPPNLAFHFAHSDALTLAMTPEYLHRAGLRSAPGKHEDLSRLLKVALQVIPRIHYSLISSRWQTMVSRGETLPGSFSDSWSELAKGHTIADLPKSHPMDQGRIVYFVEEHASFYGDILQFQFLKSACQHAGYQGAIHRCSLANRKSTGPFFWPMLSSGASKSTSDTLAFLSLSRKVSAQPLLEYFTPLYDWLDQQNEKRFCNTGN